MILDGRETIREEASKETYLNIRKTAMSSQTSKSIDEMLNQADKERKEHNDQRAKRKLENDQKRDKNKK